MKPTAWLVSAAIIMAPPAIAEQPSHALIDLRQAPASPSVLTPIKKEDPATLLLRAAHRENVTVDGFDDLLKRQKARDEQLMAMLAPDSTLTHAAAKAFQDALGKFLTDNVAPQHAQAIALQMVQSIFLNRRDDLKSVQVLYNDPAWQKQMRARLAKGEVPALSVASSEEKRSELQNTALYVHKPGKTDGKIEPAVHIFLSALGHQIGHAAIAEITKPGSALHQQFLDTLAKALPADNAAEAWMKDWLSLREGRASDVAGAFAPDGVLIQDALKQSETNRRARMKNPVPVK